MNPRKNKRDVFDYNLKRLCILPLETVLPHLSANNHAGVKFEMVDGKSVRVRVKRVRILLGGHEVCINSLRLVTFKTKGLKCHTCGIEGKFFAVEQTVQGVKENKSHINLYAVNADGKEVLMTHDHIVPRSKGGKDAMGNTQTMCVRCNYEKGADI